MTMFVPGPFVPADHDLAADRHLRDGVAVGLGVGRHDRGPERARGVQLPDTDKLDLNSLLVIQ